MDIFTRIKTPSKWKRNYLVDAMKKRKISTNYSTKGELNKSVELLITNSLSEGELESLKNLRHIIIPTSGTENLPLEKIKKRKIKIYQNKEIIAKGIANYTIDNLKKIIPGNMKEFLKGKTVTLLGFGNIGKLLYNSLKKYEGEINIVRKKPSSNTNIFTLKEIDSLLSKTDILINALPLNDQTKGILVDKTLMIKEGCIIINLSRRGILNEKEIIDKVKEKYFFGTIMDVYSDMISISDIKSEKIILTPHIAGIYGRSLKNLIDFIENSLKKIQAETN
jgi:phosphoglycerate dehydrogenase-like enzyme